TGVRRSLPRASSSKGDSKPSPTPSNGWRGPVRRRRDRPAQPKDRRGGGLRKPPVQLLRLLRQGLAATASLCPPLHTGHAPGHHPAHPLATPDALDGPGLRQAYQEQVLTPWQAHNAPADPLASAAATFAKVSASYWPDLFH